MFQVATVPFFFRMTDVSFFLLIQILLDLKHECKKEYSWFFPIAFFFENNVFLHLVSQSVKISNKKQTKS